MLYCAFALPKKKKSPFFFVQTYVKEKEGKDFLFVNNNDNKDLNTLVIIIIFIFFPGFIAINILLFKD